MDQDGIVQPDAGGLAAEARGLARVNVGINKTSYSQYTQRGLRTHILWLVGPETILNSTRLLGYFEPEGSDSSSTTISNKENVGNMSRQLTTCAALLCSCCEIFAAASHGDFASRYPPKGS